MDESRSMNKEGRSGPARRTVLVVEDEASIRESLVELFVEDAEVTATATLPDALRALRDARFDLIISDIRLGARMDGGFQVMAAAGLLAPEAAIIALTAYPSDASRAASTRLGARFFLEKPADLEQIAALAASVGVPPSVRFRYDAS